LASALMEMTRILPALYGENPEIGQCPRGAVMTHPSWDEDKPCVLGMWRLPPA
jgi:hypothetical protein